MKNFYYEVHYILSLEYRDDELMDGVLLCVYQGEKALFQFYFTVALTYLKFSFDFILVHRIKEQKVTDKKIIDNC
jgi:hypothetical protein